MLLTHKKIQRNIYKIITCILIIIVFLYIIYIPPFVMKKKIVEGYRDIYEGYRGINDDKTIYLKVANDDKERANGLMFVKKMKHNEGMLFEYETEGYHSMWMKNTYISLDIIYLDIDYNIVDIIENTEPHSLKGLPSKKLCKYAIELNANSAKKFNFKINDNIKKNIKIIDNLTTF